MSILIKGMEMPTEGEYRMTLYIFSDGSAGIDVASFPEDADRFEAVPVPPHGDLIDRDAILMAHELSTSKVDCSGCKYKNEMLCPKYELCEALNDAPTIIPAEEGE